jgi:hypothetical protein
MMRQNLSLRQRPDRALGNLLWGIRVSAAARMGDREEPAPRRRDDAFRALPRPSAQLRPRGTMLSKQAARCE